MKKKILIVGNTNGLAGVKIDVENYKRFFKSLYGGEWNDGEIIEKINVSKTELLVELAYLRLLSLDYVIVVFSGHGGHQRGTFFELNTRGEIIPESDFKDLGKRQLSIYDCCRCHTDLLEKSMVVNQLSARSHYQASTRAKYERRIMDAIPQHVLLYACAIGEKAHDSSTEGGGYSKNLIKCSASVQDEYKLVGVAHEEAASLTTREYSDQHPTAELVRCLSFQQLIIGIKP